MGIKIISKNKRAFYDFLITERLEAGIQLQGTEVKSLREAQVRIADAFVTIDERKEAWIHNLHISHYAFGNINNHVEGRKRKLLLNRKEIDKLYHEMKSKNLTIIPISIYFKKSNVKVEIGLAKGKKLHDKRQDEAKKDAQRKIRSGDY